jgi:hypothetical protein
MGVITRGLVTRGVVAPAQPIFFVGTQTGSASASTVVSTSQTPTFTTPGDLMIYGVSQNQFGGAGSWWTPPAGWTEVHDNSGSAPISSAGWKIATATDAGATWTSAASGNIAVAVYSFRNATIDVVGTIGTPVNNAATITIPGITTTVANTRLVAIVMSSNATGSLLLPAGNWPNFSYTTGSPGLVIMSAVQSAAGPTGNITTGFTGATGTHWGILLSIKPK